MLFSPKKKSPLSEDVQSYIKASYPNNHNYLFKSDRPVPKRQLKARYNKIRKLYPKNFESLLDLSSCKGFFVFAAETYQNAERCLGIDISEKFVDTSNSIKEAFHFEKSRFELMQLYELAERIDEFGGPFQTALLINCYQYIYFGSDLSPPCYESHEEYFALIRKVCNGRLIFNNRVEKKHCQNVSEVERAGEKALVYNAEAIIEAASKYFKFTDHGSIGRYPLWTFDAI